MSTWANHRDKSVCNAKLKYAVFIGSTGFVEAIKLIGKKTVTAAWCIQQCLIQVLQTFQIRGLVVLHHDNASSQTAALTVNFLRKGLMMKPVDGYRNSLSKYRNSIEFRLFDLSGSRERCYKKTQHSRVLCPFSREVLWYEVVPEGCNGHRYYSVRVSSCGRPSPEIVVRPSAVSELHRSHVGDHITPILYQSSDIKSRELKKSPGGLQVTATRCFFMSRGKKVSKKRRAPGKNIHKRSV
ncbi:hypothetical protein EVAR_17203_1 [Eumeta japonica]|uniref:Mariner Mos1 transposase n=1 Tax=Eumeta variegata TaxID=151549 RepID=A0A4C1U952_EUMVA|nr:hypothetical protein EVAR_17203_1 [Eumeta japonica]